MRIGILVPSIGNFGQKGFYNLQEVGLAKALDAFCEKVRIWRLAPEHEPLTTEKLDGCKNTVMRFLPARKIGTNGIVDFSKLDKELDVLICFADTQLAVPSIYRWAVKNDICFVPYIGVIESHSVSYVKQKIMNSLFKRNLKVYKKCYCLAKTSAVKKELRLRNVGQVTVVPVGLDVTLLRKDYACVASSELRAKYRYQESDKVILFIGRLNQEKQPVLMAELFEELARTDERYKLLMVGKGELKAEVRETVSKLGLDGKVVMLDRIPNSDIWELYRLADVMVNLNQQEIFGMAILEAMYYGCPVVAWRAPGPSLIIEDGVTGWLVDNQGDALTRVREIIEENGGGQSFAMAKKARERVEKEFTWNCAAGKIMKEIAGKL